MLVLPVQIGIMEKILNEGLSVLTPAETRPLGELNLEGVSMRLEERTGEDPTGRAFFARGMHDLGGGYVQVTLDSFMEDVNPETGKSERYPMAGDYQNEKYTIPVPESVESAWNIPVAGEKPIWLYRGMKWVAEYSLSKLFYHASAFKEFGEGKPVAPTLICLKVQGQGGETDYIYRNEGHSSTVAAL